MTGITMVTSGKAGHNQPPAPGIYLVESGRRRYKQPSQRCVNVAAVCMTLLLLVTAVLAALFYMRILGAQCTEIHVKHTSPTSTTPQPSNGTSRMYGERYDVWNEMPVPDADGKTAFSFDDMYNSTLKPRSPQGQWVGNNEVVYLNDRIELVLHNINTDVNEVIMTNDTFIRYRPNWYQMSPDRLYILIAYQKITEIQDPSTFAKYKVYERQTGKLLSFPNDDEMKDQMVMYNIWTPIGSGLTFVFGGDMYYQKNPQSRPDRLTTSGAAHNRRNGISYWNYRGVLQASAAIWWSADMAWLAYGEFDSTNVTLSEHPIYNEQVYPDMFRQVYLKAGDPKHFSYSRIQIIDMKKAERPRKVLSPPNEFKDKEHYFYKLLWKDSKTFAVGWTDRIQKQSIIDMCDVVTLKCTRNHELTVKGGWFRGPHLIMFINGGSHYLGVLSKHISELGRYRQVVMISTKDGKETYLTNDAKEVYGIDAYDNEKHLVYYSGTNGNQLERHVFRVGTPEAAPEMRKPVCLTCDEGAHCGFAAASFSWSVKHYLLSCLGPEIPTYHLRWIKDKSQSYTIEDNAKLKAAMAMKKLPTKEFHEVSLINGFTGWAEFILPPGMVKDGSVKYPVIFYPYAGPHGHTQGNLRYKARSAPGGLWDYYLASSHNVVVVRLNGRGSGGRGDEFLFQLYRKLGTVEITDQIDGARSIRAKFPFIDGDRMAIWGWSYGGYTSSHAIGHPSDVFKCGIAVAPVINYRHYYAAYTERYMDMDTNDDNAKGYDLTDATRKVENFRNKKYMIAHGTLDDNVHLQMAMEMISALSKAQIPFKTQIYVDQSHSIRDYYQNRHLFMSMTDFYINDCLGGRTVLY